MCTLDGIYLGWLTGRFKELKTPRAKGYRMRFTFDTFHCLGCA